MQTLRNDGLTVRISRFGAELQSIVKDGHEYLWQGDPEFWGRRSPVLFPIVGNVYEGRFRVGGREYRMGQHGIARDMDFELVSCSDTKAVYRLESSEESLEKYPWPFVLEITYVLDGNCLEVIWDVRNPGNEDMWFQIGAHPAFYYPDYDPQKPERGFFVFDKPADIECVSLDLNKGCARPEVRYPLPLSEDGILPLNSTTFDEVDTFVIEDSQVGKVAFLRPDRSPYLTVTFDAPLLGLWSPPHRNAPFVCIEPWYGRCDRSPFEGEFCRKDWINRLAPGESFHAAYTVEIA